MCLATKPWGKVVDVGPENKKLKVGDRVVVPFTISCGECFFCKKGFFSGCERSNPNHKMAEKLWGAMARVLIGTSGWHYNSWRGPFFPKGLPLKCQLPVLCQSVSHSGTEWRVLQNADAGGC
jgi:D-arabinose 1-dehydrogenase-like Zn-dependent alcohol dehydrogenase